MVSLLSVRLNDQQKPGDIKDVRPASGVPVKRRMKWLAISFLIASALVASPAALADALQDYAQQCDDAIGASATVQDFDCDAGTTIPTTHPTDPAHPDQEKCDEPNRLNKECDPGSTFQVLTRSDDAYVVALCRKKKVEGNSDGEYGDIAVIQYNRKNGATCFYQALAFGTALPGGSSRPGAPVGEKPVKAPSKGQSAWRWLMPSGTASIGCGGCHDDGVFIRSPYLNQVKGPNALPGSDDDNFNSDQPYAFVGQDFATWKAFMVEVGNECNNCHRVGVNNVPVPGFGCSRGTCGTALDFAERATSATEISEVDRRDAHKNPPSAASPMWMPPHQVLFNQAHANSAKAIHDCAARFHVDPATLLPKDPLPDSDSCRITQFAAAYTGAPPPPPRVPDIVTIIELIQMPLR
jgi:hypothetical protein